MNKEIENSLRKIYMYLMEKRPNDYLRRDIETLFSKYNLELLQESTIVSLSLHVLKEDYENAKYILSEQLRELPEKSIVRGITVGIINTLNSEITSVKKKLEEEKEKNICFSPKPFERRRKRR